MNSVPNPIGDMTRIDLKAIIFSVLLLPAFSPFGVTFIRGGLDPSWVAASAYALSNKIPFGSDFIYTMGPLSGVFTSGYTEGFLAHLIFAKAILIIYCASCLAWLYRAEMPRVLLVAFAILALAPLSIHTGLTLPALLFGITTSRWRDNRIFAFASGLVLAIPVLAKFSAFPITVASLALADGLRVFHRRGWPVATFAFVGSSVLIFLLLGQPISSVPPFFLNSLDMAAGYTAAMSGAAAGIWSPVELGAWLAAASVMLMPLYRKVTGNVSAEAFIVVVYLWLSLKSGFVRHDLHSLAAWAALPLLAACYPFSASGQARGLLGRCAPSAVLVTAAAATIAFVAIGRIPLMGFIGTNFRVINAQLYEGGAFIQGPSRWLEKMRLTQVASADAVRLSNPLPQLDGGVDIVPSDQAAVIANGLRYTPRPTVQEYTSYTRTLIDKNRAFFEGERAPKYLFFAPGSIDGRHPASAEGSLWPVFASRYEALRYVDDMLLMRRREEPAKLTFKTLPAVEAKLGEVAGLPAGEPIVFGKIGVQLSLAGKLASFIFKPAQVSLHVTYESGDSRDFRLIPGQAGRGFFISPHMETAEQFVMMLGGAEARQNLAHATSIQVNVPRGFGWEYINRVEVSWLVPSITEIDALLPSERAVDLLDSVTSTLPILKENKLKPPAIALSREGVFAHAPAILNVSTGESRAIAVEFGMRAGSYTGTGKTEGVCFLLRTPANGTVLYQRCLTPVTESRDRGPQSAEVSVEPHSTVELVTSCRNNCAWGWSYWKSVKLK